MTCTVEQARDEMYGLLKTAMDAASLPSGFVLFYDDMKDEKATDKLASWARVSVRHNGGGQSTISRQAGISRYTRTGTLYVNLFAAPGDGLRVLDPLVKIVQDAYEGKTTPSQVWFKKGRVRELGIVKGWYQINFLTDFTYDEIK